jgi:hypothetical protein
MFLNLNLLKDFCLKNLVIFILLISIQNIYSNPEHVRTSTQDTSSDASKTALSSLMNSIDPASQADCMKGASFSDANGRSRSVGRMSKGYFYGILTTFVQSSCELQKAKASGTSTRAQNVLQSGPNSSKYDALELYGNQLKSADSLVNNYSLLFQLGMMESGGMYNDGRDQSSQNFSHDTVEAGLFQVSYNSTYLSGILKESYQQLLQKYQYGKSGACMTNVYGIGQRLSKNSQSYGYGSGVQFQNVMKSCPAMATEYMSVLLRENYKHNGPLKRKEITSRESCTKVLTEAKKLSENSSYCSSVDEMVKNFPTNKVLSQNIAYVEPENRGQMKRSSDRWRDYGASPGESASQQSYEAEQKAIQDSNLSAEEKEKAINELKSGYEDKVKEEAKAEQDNATKYIQDDIKKAEAKLANLETQKKESESVSADKIKQFEEIEKTKIPELKKQLESINSEIKSVKDPSSDEGKKKIAELTSKKNALESQIKTAETSVANFKDRNKNIDKEISEAKKNIEELKKKEAEAKAKAKAEADAKAKAEAEANAKKASASTSSPKTAATNKPAESPTTTEAAD